ncbi:MAG: hypothetical protein R2882_15930 [Gemmatimonadales bacterium]
MRPFRTLGLAGIGLAMVSAQAESQQQHRDDSFSWYIGAQAGVLGFDDPRQTCSSRLGGNLVVISKRTGLMISVDEAFGSGDDGLHRRQRHRRYPGSHLRAPPEAMRRR